MVDAPTDPAARVTPVDETRIPLAEETLSVEKRTVEVGQVRIRLRTEAEEHIARANLLEQRVEVERIPIGRVVTEAPAVREEGDVTVFPVLEEVVVFETRLVLKEELRVRRVSTSKDVAQTVTLRRQVAEVERNGVAAEPRLMSDVAEPRLSGVAEPRLMSDVAEQRSGGAVDEKRTGGEAQPRRGDAAVATAVTQAAGDPAI